MRHRSPLAALLALAALIAVGCGGTPSGNAAKDTTNTGTISTDRSAVAKRAGNVTLTVLDQETSDSGKQEYAQLIDAFEKRYPNIKVKHLQRDFNSLTSNETLLLSGSHVPDVAETDESYQNQGRLAKAGLILKLDKYADAWGWRTRTSPALLACCRVQPTGKGLGTGPLYGFLSNEQIVGVYYNQKLLHQLGLTPPKSRADFENALAKAKAAGMVPIVASAGDHDLMWWCYYLAMALNVPPDQIRAALLGQGKGFDQPGFAAAAKELASWASKNYFQPGYTGVTSDTSSPQYAKGKGLFLVEGTWDLGLMKDNRDIRFMAMPGPTADAPHTGILAAGQPWAIPTKGKHELAAALWIDFISDPKNAHFFVDAGDIPIGQVDTSKYDLSAVQEDAFAAGAEISKANTALPFFWALPETQNWWPGQGAGLLSGHLSPQQFISGMQRSFQQDASQYGGT
jgi:raffinose/stachyose/melibiose transport system substrate-binding protein